MTLKCKPTLSVSDGAQLTSLATGAHCCAHGRWNDYRAIAVDVCGACGLLLDASSPKDTGVPLDRNFLFIPLMRLEFFRVRGTHVSIPPSVISLTPFQPNAMLRHGYLADTVRSMLSFEAVCPMDMAHAGR